MTDQEKKAWLRRYRIREAEAERLREEIARIRAQAEGVAVQLSGLPRGGGGKDRLQRAVELLDRRCAELAARIEAGQEARRQTEAAIDALPDERQRLLLRLRYIDGRTWEQIAVRMALDYRWVLRLHGRALEQLAIESHCEPVI